MGSADGDGWREFAGGGLPPGMLYDPGNYVSIVSNAVSGRWELSLSSVVSGGHFGPTDHSNWYTGGPALAFDGAVVDGSGIKVEDCDFAATYSTSYRIAVGVCHIDPSGPNYSGASVAQVYAGASPKTRVTEKFGGTSTVTVEADTAVTLPCTFDFLVDAPSEVPRSRGATVTINGGGAKTFTRVPTSGSLGIWPSGNQVGTYYFGDITLTL